MHNLYKMTRAFSLMKQKSCCHGVYECSYSVSFYAVVIKLPINGIFPKSWKHAHGSEAFRLSGLLKP